jgi:hypothetical protein
MRLKRRPVDDELLLDGELVVLVDNRVLVLSQVASTALHALVTEVWTTSTDLAAHLERAIGLPDEPEVALSSLVRTLEDADLVVVEPPS